MVTASPISCVPRFVRVPGVGDRVFKNKQGCYDIRRLPIDQQTQGTVFDGKDNQKEILNWQFSPNTKDLTINILCSEQVNIWVKLDVDNLFLHARGPLFAGRQITCSQSMAITSESLALKAPVCCGESFAATTRKDIAFLSSVHCQESVVISPFIYHAGSAFEATRQADFNCETYRICNNSQLVSSILTLIAKNIALQGNIRIDERSFIYATALTIGQDDKYSLIELTGENQIHARDLTVCGHAVLKLGSKARDTRVEVAAHTEFGSKTKVHLYNAALHLKTTQVEGNVRCINSQLSLDTLVNSGAIHVRRSDLTINGSHIAQKGSRFVVIGTQVLTRSMHCYGGTCIYNNAVVKGKNLCIFESGHLKVGNGSSIALDHYLKVDESSFASISGCSVSTGRWIYAHGKMDIENANFAAPEIHFNGDIEAEYLTLKASLELNVSGQPIIHHAQIKTLHMTCEGTVDFNDIQITTQRLRVASRGLLNNCRIRTQNLEIDGSLCPEDVTFSRCFIVAFTFSSNDRFTLNNSMVFLSGKANTVHSLGRGAVLEGTMLSSNNPVLLPKGGHLELGRYSHLSAPVSSQGNVTSNHSVIFGENLNQNKGAFTTNNTRIYLKEYWRVLHSKVSLVESRINVPKIQFLNGTSVLLNQSSLSTEKFTTQGKLTLNDSQLSAKHSIMAGRNSAVTIEDSAVKTNSMQTNGRCSISSSLIDANSLAVTGRMLVGADSNVPPATLRIKDKLVFGSRANVRGRALNIEAPKTYNFGSVFLSDQLTILGETLYNRGCLVCDSDKGGTIYLGLNESVVNTGIIKARNMTINSNLVNLLGAILARQSLQVQGFYGVNLGLICANDFFNTTLLYSNLGLILPYLSSDLKYILSMRNLTNATRVILTNMFPGLANLINLSFMLPGFLQSAQSLYKLYEEGGLDRLKNMRTHELMPYASQFFSAITLAINGVTTGVHAGSELKNFRPDGLFSGIAHADFERSFVTGLSMVAGRYRNISMMEFDTGVTVSGTSNHSSFFSFNGGVQVSGFYVNNTRRYGHYGDLTTFSTAVTAKKIINNGTLHSVHFYAAVADQVTNTEKGIIDVNNATVQAGSIQQDGTMRSGHGRLSAGWMDNTGTMSLEQMDVQINSFHGEADTTTTLRDCTLTGTTFIGEGRLNLENTSMAIGKKVSLFPSASERIKNSTIETGFFADSSSMQVQDHVRVIADDYRHNGDISSAISEKAGEQRHTFDLKCQTAQLAGKSNLDKAVLNIQQFPEAAAFILGEQDYINYNARQLGVTTGNPVQISAPIYRSGGLDIGAPSVTFGTNYETAYDFSIQSEGEVRLQGCEIKAQSVSVRGDKVTLDGARILSDGNNYIEGNDIHLNASQHQHTSRWTSHKPFGGKTTNTEVRTYVTGNTLQSINGGNFLRATHGDVEAVATQLLSNGGTQIYAEKGDVKLYSSTATDVTNRTKKKLWGLLEKSKKSKYDQYVKPTLVVDKSGKTRIFAKGSIDTSAIFLGRGELTMEAGNKITLGRNILNHTVTEDNRHFGISLPGKEIYNTLKHGGNLFDIIDHDPTVAKVSRLGHSNSLVEWGVNSARLATDEVLTGNNLPSVMRHRYGLTPSATLSLTHSKTSVHYQTLAPGGIDYGGKVSLKAKNAIHLENGAGLRGSEVDINTSTLGARGATLHSSFTQKVNGGSVSFTPTGQVQGFSASRSRSESHSTKHVNSRLVAEGDFRFHNGDGEKPIKSVILEGATMESQTMSGGIQNLNVTTKQDTHTGSTTSLGIDSNRQVSFFHKKEFDQSSNQQSGIHVKEGGEHSLHIKEANLVEGSITGGKDAVVVNKTTGHSLEGKSRVRKTDLIVGIPGTEDLAKYHEMTGEKNTASRVSGNSPVVAESNSGENQPSNAAISLAADGDDNKIQPDFSACFTPEKLQTHQHDAAPGVGEALSDGHFISRHLLSRHPAINDALNQLNESKINYVSNNIDDNKHNDNFIQSLEHSMAVITQEVVKTGWEHELGRHIQTTIGSTVSGIKIDTKTFMHGTTGTLITFGFNIAKASTEDEENVVKRALSLTGADTFIGVVAKAAAREAGGPVCWGVAVMEAVDGVTYSSEHVENLLNDMHEYQRQSHQLSHDGHPVKSFLQRFLAAQNAQSAGQIGAAHKVASIPGNIADTLETAWDSAHKAYNNHGFFADNRDNAVAKAEENKNNPTTG